MAQGITKQEAAGLAVQAQVDIVKDAIPLRERLEAFWRDNPLPPTTGQAADKAFFDEISGDV